MSGGWQYLKISIIVPVYNERKTIKQVIDRLLNLKFNKEIIVVDDGSTDNTADILRKYRANKEMEVICHKYNQGKGRAIITGLTRADSDYIIIQDADLEQNPEDIERFFPEIDKGYKAIFGTRVLDWGDEYNIRHTANLLFSFLINILFRTHLTDIMSGYKMIETDLFKSLRLTSNSFGIEPEITIRVIENGISIREVSVSYNSRNVKEGKKIRFRDSFVIIYTIIKLFIATNVCSIVLLIASVFYKKRISPPH